MSEQVCVSFLEVVRVNVLRVRLWRKTIEQCRLIVCDLESTQFNLFKARIDSLCSIESRDFEALKSADPLLDRSGHLLLYQGNSLH